MFSHVVQAIYREINIVISAIMHKILYSLLILSFEERGLRIEV